MSLGLKQKKNYQDDGCNFQVARRQRFGNARTQVFTECKLGIK